MIVRSIMKSYGNFSRCTIFKITYAMCSTYIFACIMTLISNFMIIFIFQIFFFLIFLYKYKRFLYFRMIPAALLLMTSFFSPLRVFWKIHQNFFIQSLPLHLSCLFSMFLNDDIIDIDIIKLDVHLLLLWINFQNYLYIHQIFLTFKICLNSKWCFIGFLILIKF